MDLDAPKQNPKIQMPHFKTHFFQTVIYILKSRSSQHYFKKLRKESHLLEILQAMSWLLKQVLTFQ